MKEFEWLEPTLDRISALLRMPDRHNSYGFPKPDPSCAIMAIRAMATFEHLPVPEIMPTLDGGLDFTWRGTKTKCFLCASFGKVDVCVVEDDVQVYGSYQTTEDCLQITLGQISREFSPAGKTP